MSERSRAVRDVALLVALRLAVSAAAWAGGFRAVSDDDFARVVLSQLWAHEPALDPTGTSWLPLPFWLQGTVMGVAGTEIEVARATAWVLGVGSTCVLYAAGRLLLADPRDAWLGAALATLLPWSVRLGVATVPELPAAALTVFAIAAVAARCYQHLGGLALLAATLSRYEPWPVAAVFAVMCGLEALQPSPSERPRLLGGAALAVAGPLFWIGHNAVAHGDPFHFLARVSAYKEALGGTASLIGYPVALLREEPEICAVALVLGGAAWWRRRRMLRADDPHPARWLDHPWIDTLPRVTMLLGAMLAFLVVAALPGGAPTHHAGRAVLAIWLVVALYVGVGARFALHSRRRGAFAIFVLALMPLGAFVLRPWFSRLDAFTPRRDEVAIGRAAREADGRILLEVVDYRFFAIEAGSGVPWRFVRDRSIDPRGEPEPSSFSDPARLRDRMEDVGAGAAVGRLASSARAWGAPDRRAGIWGVWTVR